MLFAYRLNWIFFIQIWNNMIWIVFYYKCSRREAREFLLPCKMMGCIHSYIVYPSKPFADGNLINRKEHIKLNVWLAIMLLFNRLRVCFSLHAVLVSTLNTAHSAHAKSCYSKHRRIFEIAAHSGGIACCRFYIETSNRSSLSAPPPLLIQIGTTENVVHHECCCLFLATRNNEWWSA